MHHLPAPGRRGATVAGKKPDQDAAADFFGDADVDWLSDEEEAANRERMAVAPPPPPPTVVRTATPLDGNGAGTTDWESKVTEAPADPRALANAPTLIF